MGKVYTNRTGEIHTTKEGYKIKIIEYESSRNCTVMFLDSGIILKNIIYLNVKNKSIRNKNRKSIYGIGCHGFGKYSGTTSDKKEASCYGVWRGMLRRCYYARHQKKHPTYLNVSVAPEWHNFQNFAKWYEDNYKPGLMQGWQLDKDILVKGNKIYSPETCCFVPPKINLFFQKTSKVNKYNLPLGIRESGKHTFNALYNDVYLGTFNNVDKAVEAYNNYKKDYIKKLAYQYKNILSKKVYKILIRYKNE